MVLGLCFFFVPFMSSAKRIFADNKTVLSGQVTDAASHNIANAAITAVKRNQNSNEPPKIYKQLSDASGKFMFQDIEDGEYDVTCQKLGYQTQREHVTIKKGIGLGVGFVLSAGNFASNVISLGDMDPKTTRLYVATSLENTAVQEQTTASLDDSDSPNAFNLPYADINDVGAIPYGGNPVDEDFPDANFNKANLDVLPLMHNNSISVFDWITRKMVASIPMIAAPSWLLFAPDGNRFWTVDAAHNLSMFSGTGDSLGSVNLGDALIRDFTANQTGSLLYLVADGWPTPQLYLLDGQIPSIRKSFDLPSKRGQPGGIAVLPDGKTVVVTMGTQGAGWLEMLDAETGHVLKEIKVGEQPLGVGVTPDGKMAVVANYGSASADIISLETGTISSHVNTGIEPSRVCIRPDGQVAFISNKGDNTVTVINLQSLQSMSTIAVGSSPMGMASSPDGKTIFVANHDSGNVTIIDGFTFGALGTTPPVNGVYAVGLAFRP